MAINTGNMTFNQGSTGSKPASKEEDMAVIPYDIMEDKQKMVQQLANSQTVESLTAQIEVSDLNTIVSFGGEVAESLAKASDVVLNSMSMSKINESSKMLTTLSTIMDKFDIDEIKDEEGFFDKLFNNAKKKLEKVLGKYQTMGGEVDKVFVQLKQYEAEIKESNRHLENIFKSNVEFYHELIKYIVAGDQGVQEIEAYTQQLRQTMETTGDQSLQFEISNLEQASMMLQQRTHDLRIAENVAMQSIPMIKTMQFSNMNLVRKINSAFIITLPIFKQALAQAIMLKRQRIQAEALSALDEKTNEMLLRNARNTAEQSKMTATMVSGSSIKIETLEETWRTIMTGIQETQQIQADAQKKREEDRIRLDVLKREFEQAQLAQKKP